MNKDIQALRELTKKYIEIANNPAQEKKRNLWRKHNSFSGDRPLIYVRAFAFQEIFNHEMLKCEDLYLRNFEYYMHMMMFRDTIGDDFIIEPWLIVEAVYEPSKELRWGVPVKLGEKPNEHGAAAFRPVIEKEGDISKLVIPKHKIDERATRERFEKLYDAVGDIVSIQVQRSGSLFGVFGDISTDLAKIRGLEQIMWDAYDRPEWFHKLLAFMRDGILRTQEEAELNGDISLADSYNQAMPYAQELNDPKPNIYKMQRKDLWYFMAAQEFTTFGPDKFHEFILQYQIPIMEKFGMVAYGCCEDLTQKIDYLRKIPNLRRIAVTPFANAKKCSEQIGKDYILSWRPDPSSMISTGLDEDFVRRYMREHFEIFKANGNHFDITLKDVETINHQPENVSKWVNIVREEIETGLTG